MRKIYSILMIAVMAALLLSCGEDKDEADSAEGKKRLEIVTTTGMIADMVRNIGGDAVNVTALMGPGVDPHLYTASEADIAMMAKADIIFYNGLDLENAMMADLKTMKAKTFAVIRNIDRTMLIQPDESKRGYDPHVWFDIRLWMTVVESVRDKLIEHDRASAVMFDTDTQIYLQQLADLHDYVLKLAQSVAENQRMLVTAHDAFSYFGRSYGFQVRSPQDISTANEIDIDGTQKIVQMILDRRIAAIFAEPSVPKQSIIDLQKAVTSEGYAIKIGGHLYSDALGAENSAAGTYIGMVTHNIEIIVNALHGGKVSESL